MQNGRSDKGRQIPSRTVHFYSRPSIFSRSQNHKSPRFGWKNISKLRYPLNRWELWKINWRLSIAWTQKESNPNLISVSFSEWNSDPHSIGGPLLEELFDVPYDQFKTSEMNENIGKIDESIILNFGHVLMSELHVSDDRDPNRLEFVSMLFNKSSWKFMKSLSG